MTTNSSASDDYVFKETATLNWTVNGFSNLTDYFGSENFSAPNSKNKFQLTITRPRKKFNTLFFNANEVRFSIYYYLNKNDLQMRYRVSIMNANGEKQYTQENYCKAVTNRCRQREFINFIGFNDCLRYLVNGSLILNCEIDVLENSKSTSYANKTVKAENNQTDLQSDLQELLENSKFSDAALIVKEKEFKVHKAILAARSKVFEAMFSNDLEEKKQNRVEITDVEVDVFEHLLRYIYTDKIPEMDEYALELFVAADKYQLDKLKLACEQTVSQTLNTGSVVNVLVIADMHNASELKSKRLDFINANSSAVIVTDQWKQLKSRPDLLMELYEKKSEVKI